MYNLIRWNLMAVILGSELFVWGENMNYIAIDASVELTVISVFLEMGVRHDKR